MAQDLPSTDYPGVQPVPDSITRYALRILHDLRQRDSLRAVPTEITLSSTSPLPVLSADDAGRLYWAENYDRIFRWTGSAWEFAPGQTPRGLLAYFSRTLEPAVGWVLADGRGAFSPRPDGVVVTVAAPVIPALATGERAWMRL